MKKLTKVEKEVKIEKCVVIESINELNIKLNMIEDLIHNKSSKAVLFEENVNHRLNAIFELISHRSKELKDSFCKSEEYITEKINCENRNQIKFENSLNTFDRCLREIIECDLKNKINNIHDKPLKISYFEIGLQVLCILVFFVGLVYSLDSIIGLLLHLIHFKL